MVKILLQAFFYCLKNDANQNKRCFSVASTGAASFFWLPTLRDLPEKDTADGRTDVSCIRGSCAPEKEKFSYLILI